VPAGRYARQALAKAAVAVQPVSDEPSVKAVTSKVALGEADAGIVYVTDVVGTRLTMVAIPDQHNVVASYPIAVLTTGRNPEVARELVAFALAGEGRRILKAAGFGVE
jgi:molybdate transport system substrate-binding protein